MPVVRDSDGVEPENGREKWSAVEQSVDEVTTREGDFGRMLSAVARAEGYPDGPLERAEALLGGSRGMVPAAVARGGYQALVVDTDRCEAETDLLVELGWGRGRNVLFAWLLSGPWSARHVAAEYTEAGRRVATRLGAMARELSANLAELLRGLAEAGDIPLGYPVLKAVGVNPANATTIVA